MQGVTLTQCPSITSAPCLPALSSNTPVGFGSHCSPSSDRLDSVPPCNSRRSCSSAGFLHTSCKEPEAAAPGFPKRGPRTTHRSVSGFQVNINLILPPPHPTPSAQRLFFKIPCFYPPTTPQLQWARIVGPKPGLKHCENSHKRQNLLVHAEVPGTARRKVRFSFERDFFLK